MPCAETAPLPLAATAVTVLAGDGFTMAVGLLLLGGVGSLRITAAAAVCLIVAFALAGPGGVRRAARHAAGRLERGRGAAAGPGGRRGDEPGQPGDRRLSGASGAVRPLRRGAADVVGCAAAVGGRRHRRDRIAARGTRGDAAHSGVSFGSLHLFGMAVMALGVALLARAADLPSVASLALEAAWLALVGHVLCRTLLLRCAAAVEIGAGTRRLDCLGGSDSPHAGHRRKLPRRAVCRRRAATRSRVCRVLAAVPVAAGGGSDRRSWAAGADRRRCRIGRGVGRPGRPGRGAAVRRGLSRRSAHAPRRRRGRRTARRSAACSSAWRLSPRCSDCCRVWLCCQPLGGPGRRIPWRF